MIQLSMVAPYLMFCSLKKCCGTSSAADKYPIATNQEYFKESEARLPDGFLELQNTLWSLFVMPKVWLKNIRQEFDAWTPPPPNLEDAKNDENIC